jgi:hypothetical protein
LNFKVGQRYTDGPYTSEWTGTEWRLVSTDPHWNAEIGLSMLQRKTLKALRDSFARGFLPTLKEVAAETGHVSHGHLLRTIDQLEKRKHVTRDIFRRWRSLRLVSPKSVCLMCGQPSGRPS